jgi:HAD superfamily hydrolase (TIGR01450 family)
MTRLDSITGWVLDVDGCLVRTSRAGGTGGTPIAGAIDLVRGLQEAGHRVVVCTNASELAPNTYAAHLREMGIPIPDEDFVTAGSAGADHIAAHHPGDRVVAVGGEGITRPLLDRGLTLHGRGDPRDCAAVLVGAAPSYTQSQLDAACKAVESGAVLYVSQDQPWFHGGQGRSIAISAVIASAITWVTGSQAQVTGKPSPLLAQALSTRLDRPPDEIAVVGDARAEIRLARSMGALSVTVLSGALSPDQIAELDGEQHPDLVIADVAELHQLRTSSTPSTQGVPS